MDTIFKFVHEGSELINDWKLMKNNVVSKMKTLNENKTSIETLERNLGSDNEYILHLKHCIDDKDANNALVDLKQVEDKIHNLKQDCKKSLELLLDLHNKLSTETTIIEENTQVDDPIGVEVSKLLWDKIDNLQLRPDPPISNIHKDDFRDKDNLIGKASASNLQPIYFNSNSVYFKSNMVNEKPNIHP